jgi:hypothetical protein
MNINHIEEATLFRNLGMSWNKIAECFDAEEDEVIKAVYQHNTDYEDPETRRLGAEFSTQMAELFRRGHSTRAIGKEFGVSCETVQRRLRGLGVDLGGKGRKLQITTEYVEMARKMRAEGVEWIAISEKIGFSIRQLQRHLQLTRK